MKVMVLGASGQLGSETCAQLENTNKIDVNKVNRIDLDLRKLDSVRIFLEANPCEWLINCTGYHKTDEVEQNTELGFLVNSFSVRELAKACFEFGTKFIHISTDYVFGGDINQKMPITELDRVLPINIYGASKALGENFALTFNPHNTYILRVASLFGGNGSREKGGNFIQTIINLAKSRDQIKVVNDQYMSPTYAKDVAVIIKLMIEKQPPAGTYHVVNTGSATWFDLASYITDKLNLKFEVQPCTSEEFITKAQRPSYSVLDNSKVLNTLHNIRDWKVAVNEYLSRESKYH